MSTPTSIQPKIKLVQQIREDYVAKARTCIHDKDDGRVDKDESNYKKSFTTIFLFFFNKQ